MFKLIEGNASFPNTVFITAYDKKQINNVISDKYADELSLFSDKFLIMSLFYQSDLIILFIYI